MLDILSRVIARKPSLKLSRRPKLADWGEYAASVYEVMGWGAETFLSDWDEIVQVQNRSTLDGSPVAQAIIKFMEDRERFDGSSTELHKNLEDVAEEIGVSISRDKAWPKSARWLWRRMQEVVPLLVAVGIEASREHSEGGSVIALRRTSANDVSDVSLDENPINKPISPDIKEELLSDSNVRYESNVSPDVSPNPVKTEGSGDTDNTDNRLGASSEGSGTSTPEEDRLIRRLVEQGMSERFAREEVLGRRKA